MKKHSTPTLLPFLLLSLFSLIYTPSFSKKKLNSNTVNCAALTFSGENGQIMVGGLTASYSQIQILGSNTNWQVQTICQGDCAETQTIPNLQAGDYAVKVQLNDADGSNCYREETITVENGTTTTSDCNQIQIDGGEGQISITGLTAPIEIVQVFDRNYTPVFRCEGGDCGNEQVLDNLTAGDYFVGIQFYTANWELICRTENQLVTVTGEGNTGGGNNTANCNNLQFTATEGQISVAGLNTSYSQVQIIGANTNWQVQTICQGDCAETQIIPNVQAGDYTVKVQLNGSNGSDCYREETVTVSMGGNPTTGQCSYEISPQQSGASVLCFETNSDGTVTINIAEGTTIYQKLLNKDGKVLNSQVVGSTLSDSILVQNNQIIKKLANGGIAYTKSIPTAILDIMPVVEDAVELTDGSFVLAGFQKFYDPAFGFITKDSLVLTITDANLNYQNSIIEYRSVGFGPQTTTFDKVSDILPLPNNEFMLLYTRGRQSIILYEETNFIKFRKNGVLLEKFKEFRTVDNFSSIVNTAPCEDFYSINFVKRIYSQKGSRQSAGILKLDLNHLEIAEIREVGKGSADYYGPYNFYDYNYKKSSQDEIFELSTGYLGDPRPTYNDFSQMAIYFYNNSTTPFHTKIIPTIEFDRIIRTGDTTCLILVNNNGGLTAFNPDCGDAPTPPTGSSADCNQLQFTPANGQIDVAGLNTAYAQVQIIGRNTGWQVLTVCNGDCNPTQVIPNLQAGDYTVKIQLNGNDGTDCYREEQVTVLTGSSARATDFTTIQNAISLYPNPVQTDFMVDFKDLEGKIGQLEIVNLYGQSVKTFSPKILNTQENISIQGMENGLYYLKIKIENMPLITKRFVVEHWR